MLKGRGWNCLWKSQTLFEKRRRKRKYREWKWKGKEFEEVGEIKYLGYTLQKNGEAGRHIRERIRRTMIVTIKNRSIGQRLFRNNFNRRLKMFEALVDSSAL